MKKASGYKVDAENGIVYGLRGKPIRKIKQGYVWIMNDGNVESVHRFIWISVNGPIPKGMEINHINGIKTDNRISNLELVSHKENMYHAYRTGLADNSGTRNGRYRHGRYLGKTKLRKERAAQK